MSRIQAFIFILSTVIVLVGSNPTIKRESKECHVPLRDAAHIHFASKRPYYYDASNESNHQFIPQGCTPSKFWYFGRHGTRNPGDDDIILMQSTIPSLFKEIGEAIDAGRTELCEETQQYFKTWIPRNDLFLEEESYLVEQGKNELFQIGQRYKSRFPNLFPSKFDNSTYFFKYTAKQRTEASAKAFVQGVFGAQEADQVYMPSPEDPDPILKFYEACPKWIEEVDDNDEANIEHDKFVETDIMKNTISKVSRRAGLTRNMTLEEITIVFTTCAFETAWKNATVDSQWCVLFDLDDFKVMAFREDLEYYWKDGYGYEINYKQACPPFKDALDFFRIHVQDPSNDLRKVQGYFSHSGANLKMLARLGLFNSPAITSSNFEQVKETYEWRSGHMDTMASNMALTLFKCENNEYNIGFYFQEIPQPFPGCNGKAFCSFTEFVNNISGFADTCNLEEICKLE